ncbi:hypothetical protein ABIA09_007870 [Bradyrhizobium yuanmingense]
MKRLISAVAIAAVMGTSLPAFGSDLRSVINAAADAEGVPRVLAQAVAKVESRLQLPSARQRRGTQHHAGQASDGA